jgi:hypothetical protein
MATQKADLDVVVQYLSIRFINILKVVVEANTYPRTNINIICTANARRPVFHKPIYQNPRI